jgi:hypothetical protein
MTALPAGQQTAASLSEHRQGHRQHARQTPGFSGCLVIGDKGKLFLRTTTAPLFFLQLEGEENSPMATNTKPHSVPNKPSPARPATNQEWFEMMKGGAPLTRTFEIAGYLTEIILLGCIALKVGEGEKMEWDGPNMRSPNCPQAAQYVKRTERNGW